MLAPRSPYACSVDEMRVIPGGWQRAARGAGLMATDGTTSPTIFAEMSALAASSGAINLGQGFPDEDGPQEVLEAARQAIADGANQYPPGRGIPELRSAIAAHRARFVHLSADPDTEVLVTAGATEALAATLLALIDGPDDEVVVFEPFYDSYAACVALAGARLVPVPMTWPHFAPDLDQLRARVSDRTRIILLNHPHNPTGAVFSDEALREVVALAEKHDALIVTDEVYEHLRFDGPHTPIAAVPGASERTVSISSAGKTFSTTGWKIGWIIAPAPLLEAILAVKQYLTYVNGSPFQPAIARGLALPDTYFSTIAANLKRKRDVLGDGLRHAGFEVSEPAATYFTVADASAHIERRGFADAAEFCRNLPELAGVVAIPLTAFTSEENRDQYRNLVRFAACKRVDVLEAASAGLQRLAAGK